MCYTTHGEVAKRVVSVTPSLNFVCLEMVPIHQNILAPGGTARSAHGQKRTYSTLVMRLAQLVRWIEL